MVFIPSNAPKDLKLKGLKPKGLRPKDDNLIQLNEAWKLLVKISRFFINDLGHVNGIKGKAL
jgi:hypothetical protein